MNTRRVFATSIPVVLILCAGCATTQPPVARNSVAAEVKMLEQQGQQIIAAAQKPDVPVRDRILSGDDLTLQVWMRDKTTQFAGFPVQQNVPDSGQVFIPHFGLTPVAGKTDSELQIALSEHFSRILKDATVVVHHRVKAVPGHEGQPVQTVRRVALMGWVVKPGLYVLDEALTLRDMIAHAGGFTEFAQARKVYVVRGSVQNPEILIVNVAKILVGEDMEKNITLQPNDAVYVPPVGMWDVYDLIRKALLPITAVRDAAWVTTTTTVVK